MPPMVNGMRMKPQAPGAPPTFTTGAHAAPANPGADPVAMQQHYVQGPAVAALGQPPGSRQDGTPGAPGMSAVPGKPGAPGDFNPGNPAMKQINQKYEDVLKGFDADAEKNQGLLQNNMGARMRESNVMANRMGGGMGVGGSFAAMQSGANAAGMNEMSKAQLASSDSRRGIMMKWMDDQLGESRRQEEHGWANTASDKAHANDLENMYMQAVINGDVTPSDSVRSAFMGGGEGFSQYLDDVKRRNSVGEFYTANNTDAQNYGNH